MAKATLPTNFKDDILASSMGSKRRYNVINNSDGTISLEDVTTYTQVGSTFGAAQINATNAAANAAADASKIIDDYDTLMANTQAGYMAGALAVKELNSNLGDNKTSVLVNIYAVSGNGAMRVSFSTVEANNDYEVVSYLHQTWETTYDGIFKNKSYSIKAANIDASKGTFKIDFITNGETTTLLNDATGINDLF